MGVEITDIGEAHWQNAHIVRCAHMDTGLWLSDDGELCVMLGLHGGSMPAPGIATFVFDPSDAEKIADGLRDLARKARLSASYEGETSGRVS